MDKKWKIHNWLTISRVPWLVWVGLGLWHSIIELLSHWFVRLSTGRPELDIRGHEKSVLSSRVYWIIRGLTSGPEDLTQCLRTQQTNATQKRLGFGHTLRSYTLKNTNSIENCFDFNHRTRPLIEEQWRTDSRSERQTKVRLTTVAIVWTQITSIAVYLMTFCFCYVCLSVISIRSKDRHCNPLLLPTISGIAWKSCQTILV